MRDWTMSDLYSNSFDIVIWIILVLTITKFHFYFNDMKNWRCLLIEIFIATCIYIYTCV